MADRCILYYITDRAAFGRDESARRHRLLEKIREAAQAGVDYIQLREKDLSARELESLAHEAMRVVREAGKQSPSAQRTSLLINSRSDVAEAVGADGVHLRSDDISPQEVRQTWNRGAGALARQSALIGVSCHSPSDVAQAAANGANFAVFAPVFEKQNADDARPAGLIQLAEACHAKIPVLALGGITMQNARSCFEAGASGIAAIRLFQENDIATVVKALRGVRG
jgi:thiamine-phosphate pyrophosphorylase